jgi:hypothetical protein
MVFIFFASTDIMSGERTSRFIGPFLRWLKPDISDERIKQVQFIVRKGGHLTEYAILCALLWRALHQPADVPRRSTPYPILNLAPDLDLAPGEEIKIKIRSKSKIGEGALPRPDSMPVHHVPLARWQWGRAALALALAVFYAITDEFHQSLTSSRFGSGWDVVIDACGAALGLALIWSWGQVRQRW